MATIDTLVAEVKAAPNPEDRNRICRRVAREHGDGFASALRDAIEADELIRANEAAIARIPRSRREVAS